MAVGQNILLGNGIFSVNDTPIALTRGGGKFITEREVREIEADGDRGPVKGRIEINKEVAKLIVRGLDMFDIPELKQFYPALEYDAITNKLKSTLKIIDTDYVTVKWEGKTKSGKKIIITVENAINFNGIDWDLIDKEEVVPEIEYTGTYLETDRNNPPWDIEYPDKV